MANVDYFLKIEGIPGESIKDPHKDEIEITSFSWGEANSGSHSSNTGGGVGRVAMQDFSFKMTVNKASPLLFHACATGKPIASALLTCREAAGKQLEYYKIKFSELVVSSYQTSGSPTDIKPSDLITFNFSKIEHSYAPQKSTGGALDTVITRVYDVNAAKDS